MQDHPVVVPGLGVGGSGSRLLRRGIRPGPKEFYVPETDINDDTSERRTASPEAPASNPEPSPGGGLIDDAERAARQAALHQLMELMRPAVQADGGDLVLVDVDYDAGIVEVQLQGACGSCAIAGLTLQGGVERRRLELFHQAAVAASQGRYRQAVQRRVRVHEEPSGR